MSLHKSRCHSFSSPLVFCYVHKNAQQLAEEPIPGGYPNICVMVRHLVSSIVIHYQKSVRGEREGANLVV